MPRIDVFNVRTDISVSLFVTDCATCGVVYAISSALEKRRRDDGREWYCPNGHSQVFITSETDRLRDELSKERQDRRELEEQLFSERVAHEQTEQQRRKLVRRVKNGVCPWCNRHFEALQQHVSTKHPDAPELKTQPLVHKRRGRRYSAEVPTACWKTVDVVRTSYHWKDVTCPDCLKRG